MKPSLLHQRHKQRTGFPKHLDPRFHPFHNLGVGSASDGCLGSNDTDTAVSGGLHSCLCTGIDHTDDRDVRLGCHRVQGQRCRRVAGDHDGLYLLCPKETDDLAGITQDGILRFASVGHPGSIPKINDPLIRQLPHDLPCHRQSSDTGIKYADRRVFVDHDSYLSNARPIRRSTSSGFGMPAASQSMGYMLMAVKPGIVLISLKITSPSFVTKKSTRDRP